MTVTRPDLNTVRMGRALIEPIRRITSPVFRGFEQLPEHGPMLLVGNHTLLGFYDVPLLYFELWDRRGIVVRALGDHAHFLLPVWSRMLEEFGVVDGTRENCGALMARGETILVFPGGAREVTKRKGEKYQLLWGSRLGFARMAIAHRCPIVPFAALGVEDSLDIPLRRQRSRERPSGAHRGGRRCAPRPASPGRARSGAHADPTARASLLPAAGPHRCHALRSRPRGR